MVDPTAMRGNYGAMGFHVIRCLLGRWYAHDQKDPVQAMVLLGHTSLEFTIKKYVGTSAALARPKPPN
jgi:hypothetical protein